MALFQISNDKITIQVDSLGAELKSLKSLPDQREYMWHGDPAYWGRTSPVLFPIVGGLKNGTYRVDGREYAMGQHGFARDMEFQLKSQVASEIWFTLNSDYKTLEKYPYPFQLEIGYELRCKEVSDILYTDCDIIHCEYEGNQSGGVLTIHNADRARVSNVVYENIRIEDAQEKLVDIKILDSKYSLDRVRGEVEDVYFRNITVDGPIFPVSIIRGFEMHQEVRWPRRIHFENVVIHGGVMKSANQMRMVVELAHELEFEGEMDHVKRDF